MSKNTGISYERLTQRIFQALHDQQQVNTIKVLQNVKLRGKTLEHQIDVYWEYERAGVVYHTVVQTKDWDQTISQGPLIHFKGVLDDLPGQPRGIFVTRTGYQSGAQDFAKANGILIYELREPREIDLKGKVGHMTLTATILAPDFSNVELVCNDAWLLEEFAKRGLSPKTSLPISTTGMTDQMRLVDDKGADLGNIRGVIISMFKANRARNTAVPCSHSFNGPTFLKTEVAAFPLLKLKAVKAVIFDRECETQASYSTPEGMVGFILKNVNDSQVRIFTEELKPI